MKAVLGILLFTVGAAAILIGTSNFIAGPAFTASAFAWLLAAIGADTGQVTAFASADVDTEFRFYAVFWMAYGVLLVSTARSLGKRLPHVPLLAGLFLLGGLGRLGSWALAGPPHLLFAVLMWIEIVVSLVMLAAWRVVSRAERPRSA